MQDPTKPLTVEEILKELEEVFSFGIWHDIPSGYYKRLGELQNLIRKAYLLGAQAHAEAVRLEKNIDINLSPIFKKGWNFAIDEMQKKSEEFLKSLCA